MKTLTKAILALTAASVMTLSANAKISYGNAGEPYVGVKVGQIDVDKPKKATAYGVYAGYNFDRNLGVQAEYIGSDNADYADKGVQHSYEAKSYGVYGTYHYPINNTPFYVNGKLGVAKTEVEGTEGKISNNNPILDNSTRITKTYSEDKTSLAGGVGVGFKPTKNLGVEATYSYLNSDASVWGVGAHLAF